MGIFLTYLLLATLDLRCFAWVFSSCGEGGYSAAVRGTLIVVAFHAAEHRLYQQLRLPSSRAQAQQSWFRGSVAPWHVGSSWIRDRTQVSCIGRQILTHCTTREVGEHGIFKELFFFFFFFLAFSTTYSCFQKQFNFPYKTKIK